MPTSSFGILKAALRSYSNGEFVHSLLELKALIHEQRDCWTAYLIKGKVNAALMRYNEAIADYSLVLQMSQHLNQRNRRLLLQAIALCANKLAARQKIDLQNYFNKGPAPPPGKKRSVGMRVVPTAATGKIENIGKFLIDRHDFKTIEHILLRDDGSDSRVRILSAASGQALSNLLQKIDKQTGVVGSCIIGRDFFIRACSLPENYDAESFGINALAVYLTARESDKLMEFHRGGQVVVRSELGYLLILEYGDLILITLSCEETVSKLVKLAHRIARIVA